MRALLILIFATIPFNAFAFDGKKASEEFDRAWGNCRMGQDESGKTLSSAEWDRQCAIRDRLQISLKAHKWCWDKSEVQWYPCKFTSYVDYANHK
jgi:hypothetical protein